MSAEPVLKSETSDGIRLLTLHRPAARNALSVELQRALIAAVQQADEDGDVGVIVLTGTDPAFSAGVDLKEMTDPTKQPRVRLRPNPGEVLRAVRKPLIAAVNGVCVTGGLEVALCCDFVIASEHARFADTHAQVGLIPGWGMTAILAHAVGVRRAKELSATGRFVSATEALAIGIVNHVVDHDSLLPFTMDTARSVLGADRKALQGMFELYDHSIGQTMDGATTAERLAGASFVDGIDAVTSRKDGVIARGRATAGAGATNADSTASAANTGHTGNRDSP